MKNIIFLTLSTLSTILHAQEKTPNSFSRNTEFKSEYNTLSNKKETLIEKQIVNIGKIGDLNFQKVILKDSKEQSTVSVLGIMTFFENFDSISKRTITLEKEDVRLLINNLQTLEQRTASKPNVETKYKYNTNNNLEIGSVYDKSTNSWIYYLKLPYYSLQNATILDESEFKTLQSILRKIEKDL